MSIYVWQGAFLLSGTIITLAVNLIIESLDDPNRVIRLRRFAAWMFVGIILTGMLLLAFGVNATPVVFVVLGALLADSIFALTTTQQPLFYDEHDR